MLSWRGSEGVLEKLRNVKKVAMPRERNGCANIVPSSEVPRGECSLSLVRLSMGKK